MDYSSRKRFLTYLLLGFLAFALSSDVPFFQAETGSCSDEGENTCDELQRICRVINQEETCGPCKIGYVEFPEDVITSVADSNTTEEDLKILLSCYEIEQLSTALYLLRFQPIYAATANMSDSERLELLKASARFVSVFNRGTINSTVELALNRFAADGEADRAGLTGYQRPPPGEESGSDNVFVPDEDNPYPPRVDWRDWGAVTPVKNQGRCGCCWAIAVTGALEGAAAITSNFTWLKALSHQQLVSCDKAHKGCNGGFPAMAFDYANDCGVAAWEDFPYTDGITGETTKDCELKGKPIEVEAGEGYKVGFSLASISSLFSLFQVLTECDPQFIIRRNPANFKRSTIMAKWATTPTPFEWNVSNMH